MIKKIFNKCILNFDINKMKTFGFYFLLLLLSAATTVKSVNYDYDLWARLIAGMAIVQTGQILKYDFLSYTPTHAWYDHEWGSSVFFYLFKDLFGHNGLLILQILLIFLTMFLIVKTIKLRFGEVCNYKNILFYFIILNSFTVTYTSLIRCHSFTFLFFMFELYLLEIIRKTNNYKLLYAFPILFLIWGNMHGGVVSGLGLLAMYMLGEALNKRPFKHYLLTTIICPLILFINPYGIEFVKFLLKATTMPRPDVVEWWPIFIKLHLFRFLTFKIVAIFFVIVECIKSVKDFGYSKLDKTKFIVLAVTLFLAVMHVKMMPFFVITAAVYCYKDVLAIFEKIKFPKYGEILLYAFLLVYSIVMLTIKDYRPLVNFSAYPIREAEFIRINHIEGKLLSNFGFGSYLSYKLYPQNTIYMDGRYEEVYDDDLLVDLANYYTLRKGAFNLFIKNKPDVIILEKKYFKTYHILRKSRDWTLVFEGIGNGVFVDSKIAKQKYIQPSEDLNYYKQTLFNTNITFKGKNRIKIEEINNRGKNK